MTATAKTRTDTAHLGWYGRRVPDLDCPNCGFPVTDLLVAHPDGFAGGAAMAITVGLLCCGHQPTNTQIKDWARQLANAAA